MRRATKTREGKRDNKKVKRIKRKRDKEDKEEERGWPRHAKFS